MTSLAINLWICGGVTVACCLASVATREYSWVDRLWSVVPVVYVWVFAARAGDPRTILVAVLVTVWGARLTFNFARRGGYAPGGEDYRWGIIRSRVPGWAFAVFNLVFIALYQNVLLLAITLPAWTTAENSVPLGAYDIVAAAVFAFAVIAAGTPLLWTAGGAVLLTLLFLGSTAFTEWISKSRHPEFDDYQHSTAMLVPWRPRRDAR